MVLLEPAPLPARSKLEVIRPAMTIQRFTILACGPEVHDLQPADIVLANKLAGTTVGTSLLVNASAILATL